MLLLGRKKIKDRALSQKRQFVISYSFLSSSARQVQVKNSETLSFNSLNLFTISKDELFLFRHTSGHCVSTHQRAVEIS